MCRQILLEKQSIFFVVYCHLRFHTKQINQLSLKKLPIWLTTRCICWQKLLSDYFLPYLLIHAPIKIGDWGNQWYTRWKWSYWYENCYWGNFFEAFLILICVYCVIHLPNLLLSSNDFSMYWAIWIIVCVRLIRPDNVIFATHEGSYLFRNIFLCFFCYSTQKSS